MSIENCVVKFGGVHKHDDYIISLPVLETSIKCWKDLC